MHRTDNSIGKGLCSYDMPGYRQGNRHTATEGIAILLRCVIMGCPIIRGVQQRQSSFLNQHYTFHSLQQPESLFWSHSKHLHAGNLLCIFLVAATPAMAAAWLGESV